MTIQMARRLDTVACVLAVALGSVVAAQEGAKVTVATKKGDYVEGVLKSATESEITVEVAGQSLRLPAATVKYISYVGRIDAAATAGATLQRGSLEDAVAALQALEDIVRVGVLRPQYSEKLTELVPRVLAFVDQPGDEWADVKGGMRAAVAMYGAPLQSLEAWSSAGDDFSRGSKWASFAIALSKGEGERQHRESAFRGELKIGVPAAGRVGFGDAPAPPVAVEKQVGLLGDAYEFDVPALGRLEITADTPTPSIVGSGVWLVLLDPSGKRIDDDWFLRLRKDAKTTGRYTLWIVASPAATYSVKVDLSPKR